MKITLNSSIPEDRRSEIEVLVKNHTGAGEIIWSSSRFPRLVIFVDPGAAQSADADSGSIFESPNSGQKSISAITTMLEDRIKAVLVAK